MKYIEHYSGIHLEEPYYPHKPYLYGLCGYIFVNFKAHSGYILNMTHIQNHSPIKGFKIFISLGEDKRNLI